MKKININDHVYSIVQTHPEVKDILVNLGFDKITKPGMLESVGRFMTLKAGAKFRKVEMDQLKKAFLEKGFELEEK
ncbi:MAG: DUF1858 domain-containing protein [Candidatus Izemoplasmataceae bacterium]